MYKIIASDLDGTLFNSNFILTEYTKTTIYKLVQSGINFVIATGRHYNDIIDLKKSLKIPVYLITSNGARIHNPINELIYSCDIEKKILIELLREYILDVDIVIQLYSHQEWFISKFNYDALTFSLSSDFKFKLFNIDEINLNNISKIFFTCSKVSKLLIIKKNIVSRWKHFVNVSFSFPYCLEVMSKKVSKGYSLKLVANLLRLSLKDCISFGDGMNDYEMLKMSGKGCIMENSHQTLKKVLPNLEVIGSNDNDAVAIYLNKYFNN